jgi:hypothetical protein
MKTALRLPIVLGTAFESDRDLCSRSTGTAVPEQVVKSGPRGRESDG